MVIYVLFFKPCNFGTLSVDVFHFETKMRLFPFLASKVEYNPALDIQVVSVIYMRP